MSRPPCVILAGGRATRMGGGDKGLLPFGAGTVLGALIERLGPQCGALALNANGDPARFAPFGLPVLPDPLPDWPGPLVGVLAGMRWAAALGAKVVVSAAADTPAPPRDLVRRLQEAGGGGLALAATPDGWQPTFGLWPTRLAEDLEAALRGGTHKIRAWTESHGAARLLQHQHPRGPRRGSGATGMRIMGITGYKNAGKTGLVERLVTELVARGYRVATLKHAHHAARLDTPGTDSDRHARAGAAQVALVAGRRWALIAELGPDEPEPTLEAVLDSLAPVDFVLIEGWKAGPHPKIEVWRAGLGHSLRAPADPAIRAVAAKGEVPDCPVPIVDLDDTGALADLVDREAAAR